jgi:hypothetical protein
MHNTIITQTSPGLANRQSRLMHPDEPMLDAAQFPTLSGFNSLLPGFNLSLQTQEPLSQRVHSLTPLPLPSSPSPLPIEELLSAFSANVWLLDHSIGILMPTTIDIDIPCDTSAYVEQAKTLMAELFEGISWVEQSGLYKSAVAGMVSEKSYVIKSFMTRQALVEHLPKVLNFVGYLQQELCQEIMALEIDGKMILLQMASSYP